LWLGKKQEGERSKKSGFFFPAKKVFSLSFSFSFNPLTSKVGRHPHRGNVLRRRAVLGAVGAVERVGRRGAAPDRAPHAGRGRRGGGQSGVDDVCDRGGGGLRGGFEEGKKEKREGGEEKKIGGGEKEEEEEETEKSRNGGARSREPREKKEKKKLQTSSPPAPPHLQRRAVVADQARAHRDDGVG